MALELPFGVKPVNPVPVDDWTGPYSGVLEQQAIDAANSGIPSAVRYVSMDANLIISGQSAKYWYKGGISDGDLIEFVSGSGSGGGNREYDNVAADFSMSSADDVVFADSTLGALNVYIPTAIGVGGKEIMVKTTSGNQPVTLQASGAETIDGASSFVLNYPFQSTTLISNNSNWYIS
jgi:hypothetical protein